MKSLEEYKEELEKDPKSRRVLKKLEKEYREVEENLTDEELIKYGLKAALEETDQDEKRPAESEKAADQVLDLISRKI